ncbi:MAG: GNAT family N-acetyltransferase [Clostridia bacterium]|jgi:ribosomal protein S18 acetylase RimI-like enzyme|nr:GNAT family N-acetyltransferase [Clostridia bacterium]
MKVRKINLNEIDELKKLFKHSDFDKYKLDLINNIKDDVRDIYVMIDNEKFIGELTVYYKGKSELEVIENIRVYLSAFRVLKEYQGKGLGQNLLNFVIKDLEAKGYTEFTIGVEDDNENALHIYKKFGFNKIIARLNEEYEGNSYEYNLYLREGGKCNGVC